MSDPIVLEEADCDACKAYLRALDVIRAHTGGVRPIIDGVHAVAKGHTLTLTATSSYILLETVVAYPSAVAGTCDVILDGDAFKEYAKAATFKHTNRILFRVSEDLRHAAIYSGGEEYPHMARTVEGTYPRTDQLWPTSIADEAPPVAYKLDRLAELGRVGKLLGSEILTFSPSDGALKPVMVTFSGNLGAGVRCLVMPCKVFRHGG